ncbi:MAG: lactate utilization protein [Candidatus Omnitrophota bacterium]|jgi:L-lactate utilization protein LutB
MDKKIDALIENWKKKNIEAFFCANKDDVLAKLLELIPLFASVGFSGSQTLEQLGLVEKLEKRGNQTFNPYKNGLSKDESLKARREGVGADFYLASANAISENGELVFLSAYGNRTSGIAYANNVIIICGINKITLNLEKALKRAREFATPLNYKRLNWDSSRQMCCQVLIIEGEVALGRFKVILVDKNLGF